MPAKKPAKRLDVEHLEASLRKLSPEETRELLVLTMYKLALTRSQLDAITDILVKKKVATREEIWTLTREKFDENGF